MPYNSAGQFDHLPEVAATAGTDFTPQDYTAVMNDIKSALSSVVLRNGVAPFTAPVLGVAAATDTQLVIKSQATSIAATEATKVLNGRQEIIAGFPLTTAGNDAVITLSDISAYRVVEIELCGLIPIAVSANINLQISSNGTDYIAANYNQHEYGIIRAAPAVATVGEYDSFRLGFASTAGNTDNYISNNADRSGLSGRITVYRSPDNGETQMTANVVFWTKDNLIASLTKTLSITSGTKSVRIFPNSGNFRANGFVRATGLK